MTALYLGFSDVSPAHVPEKENIITLFVVYDVWHTSQAVIMIQ